MKTACVILAAGDGKRMRSNLTKVMHPVCGEPMIAYPVSLALGHGYDPVVVVISKQGREIRKYLSARFGNRVRFAVQNPPLGTGHAVMSSRRQIGSFKGKLAIIYGDVPLLAAQDLAALDRAGGKSSVAFVSCRLDEPSGYGRVVRDVRKDVERIVEHRDATAAQRRIKEINAGLYLVDVPFSFQALGRMKNANAQGEYYLTDLVEVARAKGKKVKAVERRDASSLLGINNRHQLAEANKEMNRRLCGDLMRRGVTLVDPGSTWVGPQVKIGKDSIVQPGCFLQGEVKIGTRCQIGPGVVVTDSVIRSDVEILAYSVLDHCEVGSSARIGPFSRLRPGARLATRVHVGNFVEVKKSKLGEGSKANHLTYLGDTEIGAFVNVGAGTITCNYDGENKYQTIIEDGAFIGSDTQLVAPVKVGKGAIVGAGTTVTVDVPPGSLAVSRVRQRNIRGYAKRKRK